MLDSTSFVFLISIVAFFIFIKRKLKSRRTFKFIEISQNEKEALIEGEKAFTFTCYHENTASHLELVDVVLSDHHLLWSPLSSSPRKWKVIKNEEMLGSKVVNNGYIDVHAEGQRERLLYDINQRDLNCDFANKISRKGAYQVIVYAYAESNRKYFKDGLMIQQSQTNIINMSNNGSAPASTSWFLKMFSILNSQFSRFAELVLFGDRSSSHSKHHLLLSFLYSSNPSNPNSSSSSSNSSSSSSSLLSSEGGAEMPSYNSSASMKLSSLRFHRLILHSIAKSYFPSSSQILLHSHRNSVHIPDAPEKRKVMFIVNPVSGNKRGKIIAEMMWPFLSASSDLIDYRLIYTQRSQHGKEIAKQFDYKEYKAVVCIGGDGMIFEVINGIMERENGEEVMKEITLGIIPAGTGNGIAASLDISSVEDAVLRILRGHSNPMDIMKVHQDHGLGDIYCCLQASYGMMADVDFDSEKLRFLGELRFPLYAMYLIFFLRRYPLKLKFKPSYVKRTENKKLIFEETNEEIEFNARFLWLGGLNTKYIAKDFMGAPNAHLDDGLVHILILPIIQNKLTLFELLWQMPEGKHVTNDNIKLFGTKSFELIPEPFMNRPIRLDVDGECIPILPSVPVYVESLPAFCNIFV